MKRLRWIDLEEARERVANAWAWEELNTEEEAELREILDQIEHVQTKRMDAMHEDATNEEVPA